MVEEDEVVLLKLCWGMILQKFLFQNLNLNYFTEQNWESLGFGHQAGIFSPFFKHRGVVQSSKVNNFTLWKVELQKVFLVVYQTKIYID